MYKNRAVRYAALEVITTYKQDKRVPEKGAAQIQDSDRTKKFRYGILLC